MKRTWKYLKRGLIGLGVLLAIYLIVSAILVSRAGARLERKIAEISDQRAPVSFAQLAPRDVPANQNAAILLDRAAPDLENVSKQLFEVYSKEDFIDGQLPAEELQTIQTAFESAPNLLPLLEQAAQCTHYDPQPDYTVVHQQFINDTLDRLQPLRSVHRALAARVQLLLSQDKPDEAMQTCLTMFRLARLFDQEPATIGYLVSLACRTYAIYATNKTLRTGSVSQPLHDELEQELALHDTSEAYVHALKTERVVGIEGFQTFRTFAWPTRLMFLNDECDYLDLVAEQINLADKAYADVAAEKLDKKYVGKIGPLSQLVLPALLQSRKAYDRVRAQIRCLRTLNVLTADAHQSLTEPPDLSTLNLPAEAVTDPYTGQSLQVKQPETGWLIYAVGDNLQDDGGELAKQADVGLTAPEGRPKD